MASKVIDPSAQVHPTAVVDDNVSIGAGSSVWHFCHLSEGAELGPRTTLGQNVFIGKGVRVGARVKIQNNVSVYEGVEIADEAFIGPSVVFTNVMNPRATIERKSEFRVTRVGKGASIGANATILCGNTIGAYAFIGAGSVVTHDVEAHALVVGNPARPVGWVDEAGNRVAAPPGNEEETRWIRNLAPAEENALILPELEATAIRVLRSGKYIMGNSVDEFEASLVNFLNVPHALTCSSGTDALLLSLMAAGVGPGDEVITSPFSFFSAVGAILRLGAVPVFVDINPLTFNLNVDAVLSLVSERTRAFVPVHLFGQAAALSSLRRPLQEKNIVVIEDAAQAFGAPGDLGAIGRGDGLSCFSFFPSKNLGGFGDGGLITTENTNLAERVKLLRTHGASPKYHHQQVGGNFRMDALSAALLTVKLKLVPQLLSKRRALASIYSTEFESAQLSPAKLRYPIANNRGHTFNQYVIRTNRREALAAHLTSKKIESAVYYPSPLHLQPALGAHRAAPGAFPHAENACNEVLALPIHPALGEDEVMRVASEVVAFLWSQS